MESQLRSKNNINVNVDTEIPVTEIFEVGWSTEHRLRKLPSTWGVKLNACWLIQGDGILNTSDSIKRWRSTVLSMQKWVKKGEMMACHCRIGHQNVSIINTLLSWDWLYTSVVIYWEIIYLGHVLFFAFRRVGYIERLKFRKRFCFRYIWDVVGQEGSRRFSQIQAIHLI